MRPSHILALGPHGFHRIHYTDWGDPNNKKVLICAHGLTRNARDFDMLAAALQKDYRVVCPDMPGRGRSEWLTHKQDYGYPVYLGGIAVLLGRLAVEEVDWLGTSMGGLIGMFLAAQPKTPIHRLVLNDVGPFIALDPLERLKRYVGADPRFSDLASLEQYLRNIHAPFGALTDPQWRHLAQHTARRLPSGEYALHYDPAIGDAFKDSASAAMDLWDVWDAVRCPILVLRGRESDILSAETAAEMQARGPRARVVEFPGVGHAPALMSNDQISVIREWL